MHTQQQNNMHVDTNVQLERLNLPYTSESFELTRDGRHLYLKYRQAHLTLSTCQSNGGERDDLTGICNHQSCEGRFHDQIASFPIMEKSETERHQDLAKGKGWDENRTAFMGTAANMQYAVLSRATWNNLAVHAVATAGVTCNATCAGDPAHYYQVGERWMPCEQPAGTINLIVHINRPLSSAALTRAVVTLTEAKTAALMSLQIGSRSSSALATGTGTDQFSVSAPLSDEAPLTWAGSHTKLGELIGKAVKDAVLGSLQWQNGLDPTRCRNLFHLMARHGFSEDQWETQVRPEAGESCWPFFEANREAIVHDPDVASCASALANLMDQVRYGHLPPSGLAEQSRHLCALMIVQVGTCPEEFSSVLQQLSDLNSPLTLLSRALVISWIKKWR
jgi:adenosylcobinamide amidohydrolase